MSYTLTVFTDTTFKELFLPAVNNADYNLVLEHGDFSMDEDVIVKMEVVNARWSIYAKPDEYRLIQNGEDKEKIVCKDKASFKLITDNSKEFSLFIVESDRTIETIGKYEIGT